MTLLHQAAQKAVEAALRRAYSLGQTYWRLADSESYLKNAKAGTTQKQFDSLVQETLATIQQQPEPAAWLVTGGRTYNDRAYLGRGSAERKAGDRRDGSKVVPLYAAPPALQQQEVPSPVAHCQCPACRTGVTHYSDCAVHNMPASPPGPCNCGAIDRFSWLKRARELKSALVAADRGDSDEEFALADDALDAHLKLFVPAASPSTTRQQEAGSGPVAHLHEPCWLIEATAPPRPLYYAGPKRGGRHNRTLTEVTEDAGRAIRFPTEDSAKLTIALICGVHTDDPTWPLRLMNSGWKAAEHIFDYTPLAAAPSTPENAGGVGGNDGR